MELSKNIFFNTDRLVQSSKVKVSYSGTLFQSNAENVFIHYGFDNDWKELNEIQMEKIYVGKTKDVYKVLIQW